MINRQIVTGFGLFDFEFEKRNDDNQGEEDNLEDQLFLEEEEETEEEKHMVGFGVFPFASLFNHSCGPNLYKLRQGKRYEFRALHDIEIGDELCHCYIDAHLNPNRRRRELETSFSFLCNCHRCDDPDEDEAFLTRYVCPALNCGGLVAARRRESSVSATKKNKKNKKENSRNTNTSNSNSESEIVKACIRCGLECIDSD